jgi:hypothetical protein
MPIFGICSLGLDLTDLSRKNKRITIHSKKEPILFFFCWKFRKGFGPCHR